MPQPKQLHTKEYEEEIMATLWDPRVADDPYAFVMTVFPWGKEGTPLEHQTGPRAWQTKWLKKIAKHIADNKNRVAQGKTPKILRVALSSGRGIGKSALLTWLVYWMMSTRLGSTTIVTANNEQQLKTRTWAELGRWHTLALNEHWFERQAMSLKAAPWFEELVSTQKKKGTGLYYAAAQLWSEENPDGFAGAHNGEGLMVVFDEASGIPPAIWTVTSGFFTETSIYRFWFCMSNPRRNTGAFFECFHKNRDLWETEYIDARSVTENDRDIYESIIKQYGDDSDEARIEVYGQFPHQGDHQFISRKLIELAATRELIREAGAPLIMGVDLSRGGHDNSVIRFRQGDDARSIPPIRWKTEDVRISELRIAEAIDKYNPDAVFVDRGLIGAAVCNHLDAMGYKVTPVDFGSGAKPGTQWFNKRTDMWADMRDWLHSGCIEDCQILKDDLAGPECSFAEKSDKINLEPKERMKKRGLHSPDDGDALALTFAFRVARKDIRAAKRRNRNYVVPGIDYDLFR